MTSIRRKPVYINELPSHVFEITYYDNMYNSSSVSSSISKINRPNNF